MPRKPNPPPDDPKQSKRFIEAAREIGTDESPEAFERAFKKIVGAPRIPANRPVRQAQRKGRDSS
jgi:hypothetical protein